MKSGPSIKQIVFNALGRFGFPAETREKPNSWDNYLIKGIQNLKTTKERKTIFLYHTRFLLLHFFRANSNSQFKLRSIAPAPHKRLFS